MKDGGIGLFSLVLLARCWLPIYFYAWLVYGAYNFGVKEIWPQLIDTTQPQFFLIILGTYVILKMIKYVLGDKNPDLTINSLDA